MPLFIQWTDLHVHTEMTQTINQFNRFPRNYSLYTEVIADIIPLLRDDVIYVALSQDAQGLTELMSKERPNVLSISAGKFPLVSRDKSLTDL